jgi:hypothetical protein
VNLVQNTASEKTIGGVRVQERFLLTRDGREKLASHPQPFVASSGEA